MASSLGHIAKTKYIFTCRDESGDGNASLYPSAAPLVWFAVPHNGVRSCHAVKARVSFPSGGWLVFSQIRGRGGRRAF